MTHSYINLPDAPNIPGLRFRQFTGESDYPEMAPMLVRAFEGEADYWTPDILRNMDAAVPWVDPAKDRIIAEVDGEMIGAGRVECGRTLAGERVYFHSFNMLPDWRGRGIGTAVLHHNERRISEIAQTHPQDGPRFFQSWPISTNRQAAVARLLHRHGYAPIRYSVDMVRPDLDNIPDCPLPPGIEIRPIAPEHLRAIFHAKEEAFSDLWLAIPRSEQAFESFANNPFWRKDISCIAWDGEQCVGTVMVMVSDEENQSKRRKRAYTENITVRRPWRKRGIASALIAQSLRICRDAGFTEAGLGVDTENPSGAHRIYQRLGYQIEKEFITYRKPL